MGIGKKLYASIVFCIVSLAMHSQGVTCADTNAFCADNTGQFNFQNSTNSGSAEAGPNYGCLTTQPNPAWFFIKIGVSGNLNMQIEQNTQADFTGGAIDVDFICYGPFTQAEIDSGTACTNLTATNTIGCSYSPAAIENLNIANAIAGQYYMLLITNYDNDPGFINMELLASSTGGTDCSIVSGNLGADQDLCVGEQPTLDGTTDGATSYTWEVDTTPYNGTEDFTTVTGLSTDPTYSITNNQTGIYRVTVSNGVTTDFDDVLIVFHDIPIANPMEDQFICDDNNDGFNTYNFQIFNDIILGTQSAADYSVTYHRSLADAENNDGPITTDYTNQTAYVLETIFVRIEDNTYNYCYGITTFDIAVFNSLTAANPLPLHACDIDTDGFNSFNLKLVEPDILNGLPAANYSFNYYENEDDAIIGNAMQVNSPTDFNNTVAESQIVFVRVQPITNECFQVIPITLIVHPFIEIGLDEQYLICLAADDSILIPGEIDTALQTPPIDTNLSETEYIFQWYEGEEVLAANGIIGATQSTYNATTIGFYTVHVTNIISQCTYIDTAEVVSSYPPERILVEVLTDAFSENSMLEVTVTGIGAYEFSLYEGYWQNSPIFNNVYGGAHTVKVRDVYNCEELPYDIVIVDYPRIFTPNNDGYNDTWNILGIKNQSAAKIYIFNRYGKLIKQLSPSSTGWDGTFNGDDLPTADYWFTVEYIDPLDNTKKEFKSHFTLKR